MQTHVFQIYHDIKQADEVVDRLLAAGVDHKSISVLASEPAAAKHLALAQGTKAAEGGGIGATVGGAAGLLAGTLITAATAGAGVLAAGPIIVGLAGLGVGAAAGGLAGALIGVGIPEAEAKYYAQEVTDRQAILIGVEVNTSDRDSVREIMSPTRRILGLRTPA